MRSFQVSQSSDTFPLSSILRRSQIKVKDVVNPGVLPTKYQRCGANETRDISGEERTDLRAINVSMTTDEDYALTVAVRSIPIDHLHRNSEQQKGKDLDDSHETQDPLTPSISNITLTESSTLILTDISQNSTLLQTSPGNNDCHPDSRDDASLQLTHNEDSNVLDNSPLEKILVDSPHPSLGHRSRRLSPSYCTSGQSAIPSSPLHTQTREKGDQTILTSQDDHTLDHLMEDEGVQTSITLPKFTPLNARQDHTDHATSTDGIMLSKENIAMIVRSEMKATLQVYSIIVCIFLTLSFPNVINCCTSPAYQSQIQPAILCEA